jgi:segregation and condensation protein B
VGRPALFATTKQFLDDLGLASLAQLPINEDGDEMPNLDLLEHLPDQPELAPQPELPENPEIL